MIEVYWCHEDQSHHVKFQDNEIDEAEFFAWEIYAELQTLATMMYPIIYKPRNPDKIVVLSFLEGYNNE